ncbi:MAG: DUF1549 domain-containing protein [Planctomycetota bacterium]|nr:DUF1549 domain-containing protein [Planctomycetales bacterium]RLT10485.1 MAG: DUF1549 domain-containing protein [Planctomycetota bacterium]
MSEVMRIPCLIIVAFWISSDAVHAAPPSSQQTAEALDISLWGAGLEHPLSHADDATYLRRIMFDIVGRPATRGELTAFGLDPAEDRRATMVDALLSTDAYGENWSTYWRDVIFLRATNIRANIVRPAFGTWMASQLNAGQSWKMITTALLTASGPVNEHGASALIFAHEGVAEEVSAEASRIFLGIQIQCANCHDHPWDSWKREQFHEFAAFFPRVSVRRDRNSDNMFEYEITSVNTDRDRNPFASRFLLTRADKNRDGFISEAESKNTPLARVFKGPAKGVIDKNGDGKLAVAEIMTSQPPDANQLGRGAAEHFMPDLQDPGSQGKKIDPAFFLTRVEEQSGMSDEQRRQKVAELLTATGNPWFSRAIVNRVWSEMTGTAFYTPIDDIGPDRECTHEPTLELLADAFVANDYDLKWLIRTIAATRTYQRAPDNKAEGFAHCEPVRLRSDQLYAALCQTLGVESLPLRTSDGRRYPGGKQPADPGREEFARVFGFDPSTPRDELTGSIPEALFMMNSQLLARIMATPGESSVITQIATNVLGEDDIVRELYLNAIGREPTLGELSIAVAYLGESPNLRSGLEDLQWVLINSPEFGSRR